MPNTLYQKYKEALLSGGVNMATGNVKVVLVDLADYTHSASHQFLSDVPPAARVATSPNLTTKTVTAGVFDSADVTFTAVTGDTSEALIIYRDSGTAATSELVGYYDTGVTGLPVTPNGGDIIVTAPAGGWYAL